MSQNQIRNIQSKRSDKLDSARNNKSVWRYTPRISTSTQNKKINGKVTPSRHFQGKTIDSCPKQKTIDGLREKYAVPRTKFELHQTKSGTRDSLFNTGNDEDNVSSIKTVVCNNRYNKSISWNNTPRFKSHKYKKSTDSNKHVRKVKHVKVVDKQKYLVSSKSNKISLRSDPQDGRKSCITCGRWFMPEPLEKHLKVCK